MTLPYRAHRLVAAARYQPEPPPPPPPSPLPPSLPPEEPSLELGAVAAAVIAEARPVPNPELKSETSQWLQVWLPSYQSGWYSVCAAASEATKQEAAGAGDRQPDHQEWHADRGRNPAAAAARSD